MPELFEVLPDLVVGEGLVRFREVDELGFDVGLGLVLREGDFVGMAGTYGADRSAVNSLFAAERWLYEQSEGQFLVMPFDFFLS